ncbi:MAG: YidC/Oxa1 family membrane protein insertase, partial [Spirochaetaceae bacterium]|nr:YidC/Oxa1 family membrane protein insertase [Spirochaetaceae bacterium]
MEILYNIIIYPLVQIIEFVFMFAQKIFKETGVSVIAVSGAVSVLCLPLYNVAEKWRRVEREEEKKLKPKVDKIKAVFSGDEQYMILSAYYRQSHYHPAYAMRNTFSLLIQIPFFIAAYSYLSHLEVLKGARFLFIGDLGTPDVLLKIGGVGGINLLPVLMTLINIVSGAVYTKGFPTRDKVQLYGMAAVFLVLLYNSPAGLTLYWTCNNVFSLAKNILYDKTNVKKILYTTVSVLLVFAALYLLIFHKGAFSKRLVFSVFLVLLIFIPASLKKARSVIRGMPRFFPEKTVLSGLMSFALPALVLFLLSGTVIPSSLIASSVSEF